MAAKEIRDFIENGNIKNSVNYPSVSAGAVETDGRVTVCHKNIPNMLTQFTGVFAKENINVSSMVSKAKGDYAYTILDTDAAVSADAAKALEAVDGVVKVRVL